MSKLHFLLKHGTLDQAKQAIASSDKERLGHATSMNRLLDRMKAEGDPDYERIRDDHMKEFTDDRIKASWVVDSTHMTPKHLTAIAHNLPYLHDRVVRNPKADADALRLVYQKSLMQPDGYEARRQINFHANAPMELVQHMAQHDPSMTVRSFAKARLDSGQKFKGR